jgi:hypothetical protein
VWRGNYCENYERGNVVEKKRVDVDTKRKCCILEVAAFAYGRGMDVDRAVVRTAAVAAAVVGRAVFSWNWD